jgi:hypothetical protein
MDGIAAIAVSAVGIVHHTISITISASNHERRR